eukprot:4895786-Lingulodinium_polyedra.AAC.1
MRNTSLPLGVRGNGEGGLRAAQHQVDPRGAALRVNATRKIRIHEQMRIEALQPISDPAHHSKM